MTTKVQEKTREPNLIIFARQSFSALQKDIFTLAVSQLEAGININPNLFQDKTVTVTIQMLSEVNERKYERLRSECKDLATKTLEIYNDEKEEFELIIAFPRIKYSKGIISLTMFADVAQSFLELKNGYAEYYIRESLSLEHFNKKRLYEMLSSYKKRNANSWFVYDDELKKLLGMNEQDYSGRPKQFGDQIIEVCVNAINERTSLTVKYSRNKDHKGWATTFVVEEKESAKAISEKAKSQSIPDDEKSLRAMQKLKALNVRQDFVIKIVSDTELQKSFWKWMSQNKENIENKKFKNVAGVLLVHLGLIEPKF